MSGENCPCPVLLAARRIRASGLKDGLGSTPRQLLHLFSPFLYSPWMLQVDICVVILLILPSPLGLEQRAILDNKSDTPSGTEERNMMDA